MAKFKVGDVVTWIEASNERIIILSVEGSGYKVKSPENHLSVAWVVRIGYYDLSCRLLTPLEKVLE